MKQTAYFPALTGLRAVAAYCVFFFHFPPIDGTGGLGWQVLHALCREGHIGVSLFFTLSGFLLCRRYYEQPLNRRQLLEYAFRRWARIWPVFFLVTTATFIVYWEQIGSSWRLYFGNITMIKGLLPDMAFTGVTQTWSLTVEECFYLLAPPLFWLGRRFSPFVWAGVAAVLLLIGLLLYNGLGPLDFDAAHFMLVATIFGRSTEFLVGAAFALLPARARGQRATWAGGLLLLLLMGLFTGLQVHTGKASIDTPLGLGLNNVLLPVATASLLYGLTTEATVMQHLLGSKPMQALGKSSYCFYLLHMGLWHDHLADWLPAAWPDLLRFGLIFLLTVAASGALYYLVEKPLHKRLLRQSGAAPLRPLAGAGH